MKQITKKALSILLALVMIMTLLPTVAFAAGLTVTVDKTEVDNVAGTTVTIPVSLANNPGIASARITVSFDKSALVFVKAEAKDTFGLTFTPPQAQTANDTGSFFLAWFGINESNSNGEIAVLTFEVAEGATAGEKALVATVGEDDFCDTDMKSLPVTVVSGSITLKDKTVPVTSVSLDKTALALTVGESETLTATVTPNNATDNTVTWTTSNDKIATVENGKVTAVSEGKATITAKAGDKSAACEVTVNKAPCKHPNLKEIPAKAATCTEDGNIAYWTCPDCNKLFSDAACTKEIEKAATVINPLGHVYEEVKAKAATCTEPGNVAYRHCKTCDKNFDAEGNEIKNVTILATGHTMAHHAAVVATCAAEGRKQYWSCSLCGKNFSDEQGNTEVTDLNTLVIEKNATKHVGSQHYDGDATQHWTVCDGCGKQLSDKAPHTPSDTGEATCVGNATCDICKKSFGDVNPNNHASKLVYHEEVAATCKSTGTIEYWSCASCGANFSNNTGKTEAKVAEIEIQIDPKNHVDDAATWVTTATTHKQVWNCCDKVEVAETAHTWNDNGVCTKCGYVCQHKGGTASCTEKATCEICGEKYGNLAAHKLTKTEYKAATCTEAGNIAYWTCSVCEKLFSDENGATEVTETVIPALGHDYAADWKSNGTNHWHECTRCHEKKDVAAHTGGTATCAAKAKCDVCGVEYGEKNPAKHSNIVNVPAKAHTCTEAGYIEHYKCTGCNKLFSDANGERPTTEADIKDAAHHTLTLTAAKAPTCLEPGNNAYYTCTVCGKVFKDADGTTETTVAAETVAKSTTHVVESKYATSKTHHWQVCKDCGTVIDKTEHTFVKDEATGVETCSICGYAIGGTVAEDHQHAADKEKGLFRDENNHWYKCTDPNCTAHVNESAHDYGTETTVKEGNTTITVKKCQTCGYVKRTETTNTTPVNPGGNTSGGGSKPSGRNDGKTVESGKTFDAGIGLYVGLSILSMTGSAVVIGKKRKTR